MSRPDRSRDDGQLLVLLAGLLAVAAVLVALVADQSRLFLERRALVAAADAAAQHAAQALDEGSFYTGAQGRAGLPLSVAGAGTAIESYVVTSGLAERFGGFQVIDVRLDGDAVVVTLAEQVQTPVRRLVGGSGAAVRITATARARAPLRAAAP